MVKWAVKERYGGCLQRPCERLPKTLCACWRAHAKGHPSWTLHGRALLLTAYGSLHTSFFYTGTML